ncbi:hypothetical protein [Streptomyces sp. NPDC058622]|uniref:hypothetical protein n=1 Tax=unclassified Streptomyces TaxID=2593676 RepID=UPI0036551EFC
MDLSPSALLETVAPYALAVAAITLAAVAAVAVALFAVLHLALRRRQRRMRQPGRLEQPGRLRRDRGSGAARTAGTGGLAAFAWTSAEE